MATQRRFRWGFVAVGVVILAIIGWLLFKPKPADKPKTPTVAVSTAQVQAQDIAQTVSALGAAQPWESVLVRSQVTGILLAAPVGEGSDVVQGQLLAQIDPALYQAAVLQAEGALQRDQALLTQAKVDLARYQTLVTQDAIPRQQLETQAALVTQDEGLVKIDQGALAVARTNLSRTRIVSPVAGRVGVRAVDPGNLVTPSDANGIMTVNEITPIAVTFTVPQGDFQRLSQASGDFSRPLAVQALSQETGDVLGEGQVTIADNHVDASTGTVQLKARFGNVGRKLWPGQFVNVKLTLQVLRQAIVVPSGAVNQGPKGPFAYVVGADHKAQLRPVTVAATESGQAIIQNGLKAGETVVIDGQLTLKPGSQVSAKPGGGKGGKGGKGKGKAAS